MADSSNTSANLHNVCLICKENDDRKLMPCPAENPNCSNGCCLNCLIPAIDYDQRKPMRCQACHMVTTIEDYSTALGFKNHILVKRNQPKVDLSAIAAPVFFNDEDMDQTESGDQQIVDRPVQEMVVDQSMDEVGPGRVLCPGLACLPDRDINLDYLIKCRETCPAVYHAYCLLRVSWGNREFSCGSCDWKKTHEEWHEYATNSNNYYHRHPASYYDLR